MKIRDSLPKVCEKCGAKEGWIGPNYFVIDAEQDALKYTCRDCGFAVYLPCADAPK